MSTSTKHLGLHQWQPSDPFLRTDFNHDLSAIDEAVGAVRSRSEHNAYGLYRLLLQQHFEDKYTGYKKGLLMSDFSAPGCGGAVLSPGLFHAGDRLVLYGGAQNDVDLGCRSVSTDRRTLTTPNVSPKYGVLWTGCTFFANLVYTNTDLDYQIPVTLRVKGKTFLETTLHTGVLPADNKVPIHLSWPAPIPLAGGDICSLTVSIGHGEAQLYPISDSATALGGVFHFTPMARQTGTLRMTWADLPESGGVLGWVHHRGGGAALALTDGAGVRRAFTPVEQREDVTPGGLACTESAFRLSAPLAPGSWTLELTADRGGDPDMEVYDYGLVLC